MVSADLVPYFISGGGFAGLIVVAFIFGWIVAKPTVDAKDKQIEEYKQALALERARSDAGVLAASVVKDVMEALRKEVK